LPVKQIAKNYSLTETTVKWRLNIGRKKIKSGIAGIGEEKMDKVYKRINWNTVTCNGSVDVDKYLHNQTSRAICEAAYEKALTIEEISLKTGLPAMYIEDELPRLINGEAIVKDGSKYATNFIVLRLCDKQAMITKFPPLITGIVDYFTELFDKNHNEISKMDFYGSDLTMRRLGFIAIPAILRRKINEIKDAMGLKDYPYPARLDGGYGWFLVDEKETENESLNSTESGCNITGDKKDFIYYFWIGKYFYNNIYNNGGTRWMNANKIIENSKDGSLPNNALADDDKVKLLENNLIVKNGNGYKLNFPVFNRKQYDSFIEYFNKTDAKIDGFLTELITDTHKSFQAFVPKRLDNQINQWVNAYMHNIIGFVTEELINRNILEKPDYEIPFTNGVFCVIGEYVDV
jgi:hypothetical protein